MNYIFMIIYNFQNGEETSERGSGEMQTLQ